MRCVSVSLTDCMRLSLIYHLQKKFRSHKLHAGHTVHRCYANQASVGHSLLSDLLSELGPTEQEGEGLQRCMQEVDKYYWAGFL